MGIEIDLLVNYPRTKRDVKVRGHEKTEADRQTARLFGKEFFDGERRNGYGGFYYHPRFWEPVIPTFRNHFGIKANDSVLDVGCAKGFMLYDFHRLIPGITVSGVDISEYAINNSVDEVKPFLKVGNAIDLPYEDKSFDLVISVTTLHNLEIDDCAKGLQEIMRVSRGKAFVTLDAYRNAEEKKAMEAWNLTAKTMMHVDDWVTFFKKVGYSGDYFWFIP
jgi:SAM-dependent methyltransferase